MVNFLSEFNRFEFRVFLLLDRLPNYLSIAGRRVGFIPFPRVLALREMQLPHPGFELWATSPFPMTLTITPHASDCVSVCMCVCKCISMCVRVDKCMHVQVYVCVCVCLCICVCARVSKSIHMWESACVSVCMCRRVHFCMCICVHFYTYLYMYL